jgi:TPR repeat protein
MPLAVIWYRKAAAANDAEATVRLARILEGGTDGVSPNPAEAISLLKRIPRRNADAEYELGRLFLDANNQAEAMRYFRLAREDGSGEAAAQLRALRDPVETEVSGR